MKKQLLNETEIRKMMKFANIGSLTNTFVTRLNEDKESLTEWEELEEEIDDEEPVGEPGGLLPGDEAPETPAEEPTGAMDDEVEDVEGDVDDPEAGVGGADEILEKVATAMENFKQALELAGPEGKRAAEGLEVESDVEADVAAAPEGEMDLDAAMADEPPMPDEEMVAEVVDDQMEEDMVNEVARRVARRLRRGPRRKRR